MRLIAPLDGFRTTVELFARSGGRGLNITVPFKLEALAMAGAHSPRAKLAGSVNTLKREGEGWYGDNTDGPGIVRDIKHNLGVTMLSRNVLVLGAGGASRGIISSLLEERPRSLTISNRTIAKAAAVAQLFAGRGPVSAVPPDALAGRSFDIVINATSASLAGALPPLPSGVFAQGALAYDMMYGNGETPFLAFARGEGAATLADGLGMLVEQAAESFLLWRGVRPDTAPVLKLLRQTIA